MDNPVQEWLKKVRFKQVSYNDFPVQKEKSFYFLEKINGENDALVYERGKGIYFITRSDIIQRNLFVLREYEEILEAKKNIKNIIIPGELVAYRKRILPWNETIHTIRSADRNPALNRMLWHYPFDILRLNGKSVDFPTAINYLSALLWGKGRIRIPKFYKGNIEAAWNQFTRTPGVEGLIARGPVNYKIKMTWTADLAVIAVGNKKMKSWPKSMISYIVCAFMDKHKQFIMTSRVGTGFDNRMRRQLFDWAHDNSVKETDELIWVKPELIAEVVYRDVFKAKRPVFQYKKGWKQVGTKSSYNLFQPSFIKFRPDKGLNPYDLREEQIPETLIKK